MLKLLSSDKQLYAVVKERVKKKSIYGLFMDKFVTVSGKIT